MYIGRTLIHPGGFAANPAFQRTAGRLIDTRRLFYYGNSQGGIAGGALTAVSPDLNRSALYVGGDELQPAAQPQRGLRRLRLILYPYYPNELERPLVLSLIQILWDRGEPNGYAWHMTDDPLPNTPPHKVLQTALVRGSPGAPTWPPRWRRARSGRTSASRRRTRAATRTASPYYGIPRINHFPYEGDASLVIWDIGPLRPAGCGVAGRARVPRHPGASDHEHAAADRGGPARPGDRLRGRGSAARSPSSCASTGELINVCGRAPVPRRRMDGTLTGPSPAPCNT